MSEDKPFDIPVAETAAPVAVGQELARPPITNFTNMSMPVSEFQKRKIFFAVPMYGGQCTGTFAKSMINLATVLGAHQIPFTFHAIFNESLITRARNYCVDEFMRSGFDHLFFIDADVQFNPEDVLSLVYLQSEEGSPYDIITAPYPKKSISWEKIKAAVDAGVANENPVNLEKFVGDYVFNLPEGTTQFRLDQPVEILEGGTGFMCIRRDTFLKYKEAYPELSYKPDHVRSADFDGTREIMCYFDCEIDPKTRRYLSEDYFFCQRARAAGMKVWMTPWINLQHYGSFNFGGSMLAMAQVGVTPTADDRLLRKQRGQVDPAATIEKVSASRKERRAAAAEKKKRKTA